MASAELRPEIEQAVPRIDLAAAQGKAVGRTVVHAGLAGDADPEARLGDDVLLTLAEEPGWIGESPHDAPESIFELPLRASDLLLRRWRVERAQVGMGQ